LDSFFSFIRGREGGGNSLAILCVLTVLYTKENFEPASLCGSVGVGKDFVYHACGHEFESRLR